jgi:hypothetical protein
MARQRVMLGKSVNSTDILLGMTLGKKDGLNSVNVFPAL